MSDSLRLSVPDLSDTHAAEEFYRVADAARDVDGYDPFNEQSRFDVASGRRTPVVATAWAEQQHGRAIGAAIVGHGELDLVIDPVFRGKGYGSVALGGLMPNLRGVVTAWSHGDHPAARILAGRHGFSATRTLLQLRLDPIAESTASVTSTTSTSSETGSRPPSVTIAAFDPNTDAAEWVAVNASVFATHPEQGGVTQDDLHERMAEPWFDAGDFLVARDADGRMIGYNWLKIEPEAHDGEIYVIGVDASAAGQGLGRRLMAAGLDRLRQRGCTSASLYVEADNAAAVHLYRSIGFAEHTVDVQYTRPLVP